MGCCGGAQRPLGEPPFGCGRSCPAAHRVAYDAALRIDGRYWTTDRFAVLPPRVAPDSSSVAGRPPTTLIDVFDRARRRYPRRAALRCERTDAGTPPPPPRDGGPPPPPAPWREWTWNEYWEESRRAARGMLALGMEEKSGVCVYGFNSPEWFMAQQAAMMGNAAVCGIYPTDKVDNVQYKARHTACNVAVVESQAQVAVFKEAVQMEEQGGVPTLKAVVVWLAGDSAGSDFEHRGQHVRVLSWRRLVSAEAERTPDAALDGVIAKVEPGGLAGYIYTSGTTGMPKAVMVSHDSVAYVAGCIEVGVGNSIKAGDGEVRILSYLPLSHIAGLLIDIIVPMWFQTAERFQPPGKEQWMTVSFARPYDLSKMTLAERIKDVRPSAFLGVPRVWEKIRDRIIAAARDPNNKPPPRKAAMIASAKERGREMAFNGQLGGNGKRPGNCVDHFLDNKVYDAVRRKLGMQECNFAVTGAAAMDSSCFEFFGQLGISINEMYGMSECAGATTMNMDSAHIWGTVGFAVPGAEVSVFRAGVDNDCDPERAKVEAEISESFITEVVSPRNGGRCINEKYQGELCFRGRHVMMGYMANPDLGEEHMRKIQEQNAKAIDSQGWLHSGDKGAIDAHGMIRITGRFKEIIVPAGGENVSPIPIEETIKRDPAVSELISNVMMVGDKRKYCVAVISLKVKGATGQEPGGADLTEGAKDVVREAGGAATTVEEAMRDDRVVELIAHAVGRANKEPKVCPNAASSIKAFTIIPVDFSEVGGQLTATLKLKRSVVERQHECMVGNSENVDLGESLSEMLTPGMTGYLYKHADELQWVQGLGKCYGVYQRPVAASALGTGTPAPPGAVPPTAPDDGVTPDAGAGPGGPPPPQAADTAAAAKGEEGAPPSTAFDANLSS